MELAASRGNLEIVKWLFTHFLDCKVPAEAVEAAASNGHLGVLQFLLDHGTNNQENVRLNIKKRKVVTESGELVAVGNSPAEATHVVCWEPKAYYNGLVQMAIDNGHIDVTRWMYENIPSERVLRRIQAAVKAAQKWNDMELAKSCVPPGRDFMEYANNYTGNVQVVEHIINSGYLQRSGCFGVMVINHLVKSGRLDMMQRVANLRFTPQKIGREWAMGWKDILKSVCYRGD
ncbi:putative ankyrin repeat protein [Phytophthora citrophthora]|uniref:Ankyrin repeat protein n=1 Tax=Phytophthora citrophthora TaxID=4793 RepID=A0AAD9LN55_9STRA|nr:putative ankyrin repeat protein [Phytophthora citrophthora]